MNQGPYALEKVLFVLKQLQNITIGTHTFREKASPIGLENLKGIINKVFLENPNDDGSAVKKYIDDYNAQQTTVKSDSVDEGLITTVEWAILCNEVVQNGNILNNRSEPATYARYLLLSELKNLINSSLKDLIKFVAKEEIIPKDQEKTLETLFLNFLGELCQNHENNSVEAVHNYLHLLRKTCDVENVDANGVANLADMSGICLLNALKFSELLIPNDPKDTFGSSGYMKECELFSKIICILLKNPIFGSPFSKEQYQNYFQPKEARLKMHESIIVALNKTMVQQIMLKLMNSADNAGIIKSTYNSGEKEKTKPVDPPPIVKVSKKTRRRKETSNKKPQFLGILTQSSQPSKRSKSVGRDEQDLDLKNLTITPKYNLQTSGKYKLKDRNLVNNESNPQEKKEYTNNNKI